MAQHLQNRRTDAHKPEKLWQDENWCGVFTSATVNTPLSLTPLYQIKTPAPSVTGGGANMASVEHTRLQAAIWSETLSEGTSRTDPCKHQTIPTQECNSCLCLAKCCRPKYVQMQALCHIQPGTRITDQQLHAWKLARLANISSSSLLPSPSPSALNVCYCTAKPTAGFGR